MELWVGNILFLEIALGDIPTPLLAVCNRTGWRRLAEQKSEGNYELLIDSSWPALGKLSRLWEIQFVLQVRSPAWVSPASLGSLWCCSIFEAATTAAQSTAWWRTRALTHQQLSSTNIWTSAPRLPSKATRISLTSEVALLSCHK